MDVGVFSGYSDLFFFFLNGLVIFESFKKSMTFLFGTLERGCATFLFRYWLRCGGWKVCMKVRRNMQDVKK